MKCKYCISPQFWNPDAFEPLDPKVFWKDLEELRSRGVPVNTLEFTNPTESLPGIIGLLSQAPMDFNWPVVMNCHLYGSKTFYEFAGMISDVFLLDLRYGNDHCAKELSKVERYLDYARMGLDELRKSGGRVLVRILVLPSHGACCHEPALELLSEFRDRVWVSILDQYVPEHEAYFEPMNRRPTQEEIEKVRSLAGRYGLRDVLDGLKGFWN